MRRRGVLCVPVLASRIVLVWGALLLLPSFAWSQNAEIAGVVRDSSGAVLPGVTVGASSPALIEKTRVVYTDGRGAYQYGPSWLLPTLILQGRLIKFGAQFDF